MWKKFAVVGSVVAVAGLGVGGAASAWSGAPAAQAALPDQAGTFAAVSTTSPTTTTGPTSSAPAKKHHEKRAGLAKRLSRVSHAQWVSKDPKTGTFVTHDAVHGDVTAATTGSITVRATDGTSETFVVTGSTKVRVAGAAGTIAKVEVGDRAVILGTGSGPMTATRIVDRGAPGAHHKSGATSRSGTGSAPTTTAPPTT